MAHSKIGSCLCPSAGTTVAPGWFRWPLSSTSRSTRFLCWPVISGNPWAVRGSMTASYRSGSMCSRMNTASWSVICVHHVWCAELCQGTQVLEVLGFVPFVIVRRLLTLVCYCHTCAAGTQGQSCQPPQLQSVLDQKLCDEALESDDSMDGVRFCEDSEQKDMICFNKSSEALKWLFYAPSIWVWPKPFPEKRRKVLESIKEKMKTLPADISNTEVCQF